MTDLAVSPIGAHVPVAGGLATRGLAYAAEVDAEAVQVFVSNPRGWAVTAGDPAEDAALRERTDTGLPVFVHATYLINLGAPDDAVAERSLASLEHALVRGAAIGARGVVVHTGSAVRGGREEGLARMRDRLVPLLDRLGEDVPPVLLEPMAGQGQVLCATVDDLAGYLGALDWHPRAAVCLDTAHVFAAGHDVSTPAGMAAMLDRFGEVIGADRLRLVHANDSKAPCGSNKDRHENIGAGHIGAEPFGVLFTHPVSAGVPVVCETPGPAGPHATDIAALKKLRG
ncbi:deoxyribonuclease IV [Streptomonospora nanhaiensis]|uniref:Probable endonuclease 4 n=1 Tax=Streptomonospora nanhaiensis TaxID=1323731 RepID=A0A853BGY0_9ACTN|nr:deoxyribonuclease IV [Streptomonospora nanhaiensis]MBV2366271.1 deoxyribonuclease IV [Streptomonospora nanhaiensis]MBX9390351.1 deoxyribonuclease IV [Streptomonospora nanhaiensis]NYI93807.1 deoxyribonuclease-4 [Streptomonospora nanhaiensis]